jgi:hypothetical protein
MRCVAYLMMAAAEKSRINIFMVLSTEHRTKEPKVERTDESQQFWVLRRFFDALCQSNLS